VPADSTFGAKLARFDEKWTRLESVLCAGVLALEVAAFSFWIALKGVSMDSATSRAGLAFRAATGGIVLSTIAYRIMRAKPPKTRSLVVVASLAAGAVLGRASGDLGAAYFANGLNWLQDSSALTLLGGLRGIGTELTWWLAMLGASLATGTGKHINIDALLRFVRPKVRVPAVLLGWVMASVVCFAAVWGFFDHIAIGSFGAPADAEPGEKVSIAWRESGRHLFLLRKQLALDVKTALHVTTGDRYDGWLKGAEWNAWIASGDWEERFGKDAVQKITLPEGAADELHPPLVLVPTGGYSRGLLTRDLHLIFPFGLLVIAIRFLLRAALVAMGRADLDTDPHGLGKPKPSEAEPEPEASG
jgi:TRAP-type C4-dicarboxylate transport system permease small subunit